MLYLMVDLRDNVGLFFPCSSSVLSKINIMQDIHVILHFLVDTSKKVKRNE